eukprot:scaffold24788_cov22-Tisochrysis_lutea.AAC.3
MCTLPGRAAHCACSSLGHPVCEHTSHPRQCAHHIHVCAFSSRSAHSAWNSSALGALCVSTYHTDGANVRMHAFPGCAASPPTTQDAA